MKKIVALFTLFCLLISCERKEPNFSEEMIETLAERGEIRNDTLALPPMPIFFSDVYLLINNGKVVLLDENYLFFFYKRDYSKRFKSFKIFLNAVLNDGFIIDERLFKHLNYPKRFRLNAEIKKEYSNLGFNEFLNNIPNHH